MVMVDYWAPCLARLKSNALNLNVFFFFVCFVIFPGMAVLYHTLDILFRLVQAMVLCKNYFAKGSSPTLQK